LKYRQPGYHDKDYKEEREKRRQEDRGPRGPREPRGMAREARLVMRCFQCGHQEPAPESLGAGALCPSCRAPLHCCRNCVHFDPGARFECRQPIPAPVRSKIQANDCTLFAPAAVLDATGRRLSTPGGARAAFDALFKKK
jgi:hypothetical protein